GALGNVLVLIVIAVATPAWVGFTALPFAVVWLALSIILYRVYPTLLLEVAHSARSAPAPTILPEMVDSATMRMLEKALAAVDARLCAAACDLTLEAPARTAVTVLARALARAPAAHRPSLVETLHQVVQRTPHPPSAPQVARLLEASLADP